MSKKIYLNKSDSVASAIDKVINAPDEEVVLYIPRDAEAAKTKRDIELIKREVEASGKSIAIESVDDETLELAAASGIKATNPFLGRSKNTVSDIIVAKPRRQMANEVGEAGRTAVEKKAARVRVGAVRSAHSSSAKGLKRTLIIVGLIAGLTVVATLALVAMPRVTVGLTLEKIQHGYIGALQVSPSIEESTVDDSMVKLRGILSSKQKNITERYPATGTDSVGRKAQGIITIYNNFSTEPQALVKSTRFETPEGYIYRLDQGVTVPGATSEGGVLVPSSMEAAVTADQPGDKYNIDPVAKFTIPGFRGSSKFEGFYGESKEAMRGGSTGEVEVATDEDIESARADIEQTLKEALQAEILMDMPEDIKILEDAYDFIVVKEQIDEIADENGEFSITLYGEISLIGFDEDELLTVLGKRFSEESGKELMNFSKKIEYGQVKIDLTAGVLDSAINVESEWIQPFNEDEFKQEIAGMTKNQLKETVFSTPGVIRGEVKMWPFWVNKAPKDLDKITVDAI
ncbi:MAG: hypothetical protein PHV43_00790 [Candidatus Colwellbacteria bacterium]|nr:hypothetical protein [Candidatus Colwellbacteria bacterium]